MISITLDSIVCNGTSEGKHDEVYVVYQADAGWPYRIPNWTKGHHSMEEGDTWTIGQEMSFNRDLLITLYDQDRKYVPARSDYLVSFDYTPDALPASVRITNTNDADYTINITVNG